jgi:asparagine synthase (glutamine-hydrolysing)
MCGIVGIIDKNQPPELIVGCKANISHRGPDDSGVYYDGVLALGHQRLAIQDLSAAGHQPMLSSDENFVIIFNGEIYNHTEIRQSLKTKYNFKSTSDTETILYGFIEYGVAIFEKLNGIFAVAIFDKNKQQLIIARDHFGVKPLYYCLTSSRFSFSSEIKALPQFDTTLDYEALVNYIHFLWSPAEKTPFKDIKKLLPGYYATISINDLSTFELTKYYEIPFKGQYDTKTEEEWIEALDQKLQQAVRRQLLSDVPVGFFLSGGLDSSAIVAIARKISGKKLKCYTIDDSESGKEGFVGDLHYAKLVAKYLDVDLEIIEAKADIISDFDKMIYHLDEPQADGAPLHVLNICKKAREQGYVVLLGGAGGDDLFSGYRRHQALAYDHYFDKIPVALRKQLQRFVFLHWFDGNNGFSRRIRKLLRLADKSSIERMAGHFEWIDLKKNKHLFKPSIRKTVEEYYPNSILIDALRGIPDEKDPLNQMLFWEMKYFLTDHNLNYTDKLGMAVGVEIRVPFLDKELVEFSTTIPPILKMKGKTTKYLLKKVMERYLPQEVIYRSKTGFNVPLRQWISGELSAMIEERLSPLMLDKVGVFDAIEVQKLVSDVKKGKIDAAYSILSLLTIQSYCLQFIHENNNFRS